MNSRERNDLIISWFTISLAFAIMIVPALLGRLPFHVALLIAFFSVGTGFVFHELAHRYVSRHFGFHAEFIAWKTGLLLAIVLPIITFFAFNNPILFAAPGAVYIFGQNISIKQNGIISAAGPASNLLFAFIFYLLAFFVFVDQTLIMLVLYYAAQINAYLAFFNLLPFFVLDGEKVMKWNFMAWLTMIVIAAFMSFFL